MAKIKRKGKKNKQTAGVRGEIRRAHFESGGSLEEWRGRHQVHSSQKRRSRRSDKNKSIEESEE